MDKLRFEMSNSLTRSLFDKLNLDEKLAIMETISICYRINLVRIETFTRWGQSCTTGVFEKDGREFVFIPGNTLTIGWNAFVQGLDEYNQEELNYLFEEIEYIGTTKDFIQEGMMEPHTVTVGPMLVGRELEEIGWERVALTDCRLNPEWLSDLQNYEKSFHGDELILNNRVRFRRYKDGWQAWLYRNVNYCEFQTSLQEKGFSLPSSSEWSYFCGGGCRTIFPWGDGLDYSMRLYWFETIDEDENKPYDLAEPNFFGLSIAFDPYRRELVKAHHRTTCGGDAGGCICGGAGPFIGYLPCSPHHKPEVHESDTVNINYDFYRPVIRVKLDE